MGFVPDFGLNSYHVNVISDAWSALHEKPILIQKANPKALDVIEGYGYASALLIPTDELNINKVQSSFTIWINPHWRRKDDGKYLLTFSKEDSMTLVELYRAYNMVSIAETMSLTWLEEKEKAENEMGFIEKVKYKFKKWMKKRGS